MSLLRKVKLKMGLTKRMSVINVLTHKIKLFTRDIYFFLFGIYRHFKHPSCLIYSKHIHPTVRIGKNVVIKKHCLIERNVEIGDYTFINDYTRIDVYTKKIGKYCSISHNVKIGMAPHPIDYVSTSPVFYSSSRGFLEEELFSVNQGSTTIGNDVFIASNSIIFSGISVGDGAVISAGSVVTKDVPPYAVVGGVPAKILKYRFTDDKIEKLLKSKWWDRDIVFLIKNAKKMVTVDEFLEFIQKR